MTVNDLAKYIGAYFNIEMTESNLRRIKFYCEKYADSVQPEERIVIKEVVKEVPVVKEIKVKSYVYRNIKVATEKPTLEELANEVCNMNHIRKDQLIRKKKSLGKPIGSSTKTVIAKKQFAKIAKQNKYSLKSIAKYLNQDHTTIIYYLKQPA